MNFSYNTCQVTGCRYNEEHTTIRHICGKCNISGHGQIECGNEILIKGLDIFKNNLINVPCKIELCIDSHTHTTKGHSCLYCDKRTYNKYLLEHLPYCPLNQNTTCDNSIYDKLEDFNKTLISELQEQIKDITINIGEYKTIYGGMGCNWFIRNNNGIYQYLFMHSDNWGQYGEDSSHLPKYKAFIYGFTLVD